MGAATYDVALVTGAASGIGAALCEALAAGGTMVHALDRDAAALEALATALGPRVRTRALDVRDRAAFAAYVDGVVEEHGRLALCVLNAGVAAGGPFEDADPDDVDRVLSVNAVAVVHGAHAAYRAMCRTGGGQLVAVASMAGLHPVPYSAAYTASKHAVVGLALALREEGRSRGVNVSVVAPGVVRTRIFETSADTPGFSYGATVARGAPSALAPAAAAHAILRGARANDAIIVFPFSSKLIALLYRIAPRLLAWAVGRAMRPGG